MIKNRIFRNIFLLFATALLTVVFSQSLKAAGTSPKPTTSKSSAQGQEAKTQGFYKQGMAAAKAEDYDTAYDYFMRDYRQDAENPDILNMLAYSQRKRGNLDEAFKYYESALKLRPQFPQAREYLGEAHIQAALEQIKVLQSYGSEADHELEDLVEAFRAAAEKLPR